MQIMIILFLRYNMCDEGKFYFSFWAIFSPFTYYPLTTQKNQNEKMSGDTKNYDHMRQLVPEIWCVMVDRQRMDGKSNILRWVPNLKSNTKLIKLVSNYLVGE